MSLCMVCRYTQWLHDNNDHHRVSDVAVHGLPIHTMVARSQRPPQSEWYLNEDDSSLTRLSHHDVVHHCSVRVHVYVEAQLHHVSEIVTLLERLDQSR